MSMIFELLLTLDLCWTGEPWVGGNGNSAFACLPDYWNALILLDETYVYLNNARSMMLRVRPQFV